MNKSLGVSSDTDSSVSTVKSRGKKSISGKKKKGENIYDLTIIKEDDNENQDSFGDEDRKLKINTLQPNANSANETDGFKTSAAYSSSAQSNQDYKV